MEIYIGTHINIYRNTLDGGQWNSELGAKSRLREAGNI